MKSFAAIVLLSCLTVGCASAPSKAPSGTRSQGAHATLTAGDLETRELLTWFMENQAHVEWQVATLAASCNQVARLSRSPATRREALRLKAAYANSCYALALSPSPAVQVLDLTASAALANLVWVEEKRAATEFGDGAEPIEAAFSEIQLRTRAYAAKHLSASELDGIDAMVREWRKAHPGPVVIEFLRFEDFADEGASALARAPRLKGFFGELAGEAQSAMCLGERFLRLVGRMPRLAEWHAEATAANLLAQSEVSDAMAALDELGKLGEMLPGQLKTLQSLDARLAALPGKMAEAVAQQPQLAELHTQLTETRQQLRSLDASLAALKSAVDSLTRPLEQLATNAQPASLRQAAADTSEGIMRQARSLVFLVTACVAGIVVLQALLRRYAGRAV